MKNKINRKKIIISSLISLSGILVILATIFINESVLCQSKRTDKLLENQYFSTVQSSALSGIISAEISGNRAESDFISGVMNSASETQKNVLDILKNKKCDNLIFFARIALVVSFLINLLSSIYIFWNYKNGVESN